MNQHTPVSVVATTAIGLTTKDIVWGPAPLSLPQGAQTVVLYGDPGKDGVFALRLPKGCYHIAPHTHPKAKIVTALSGAARLRMGTTDDHDKAQVLPAGGFFAMPRPFGALFLRRRRHDYSAEQLRSMGHQLHQS